MATRLFLFYNFNFVLNKVKIIKLSKNIMELPKLSFYGTYSSIFTFKKEPSPECVSTIETCYYLIKEITQASMLDAVDYGYYRQYNEIKMNKM